MMTAAVPFDEHEAVAFLQELIRLRSVNPPGDEAPVARAVAGRLRARGIPVTLDEFAPGRANAVARLSGDPLPAVVLSGHLDTVAQGETPWARDPFSGDLAEGRIWGRGAADMKSGLAAMVMAMQALAAAGARPPRDVVLAASAGEEVDCCGASRLVERGVFEGAGGIVVGEPTGETVAVGHRGALWLEIETLGRTAHGSMPAEGINAVAHMRALLSRLEALDLSYSSHPLLGSPTMAVTSMHGGIKVNVIPDRCTATLDIRSLPGQSHAVILQRLNEEISRLREALPDLNATIRILTDRAPVVTEPEHSLVQAALRAAAEGRGAAGPTGMPYFTDASVYAQATGLPVILYGPGDAAMAHRPNEWVDRDAYLRAIRFYIRVIMTWRAP